MYSQGHSAFQGAYKNENKAQPVVTETQNKIETVQ